MSTSAFGEHLRRERELRGVSLEEVSAATRISISFLEAMERGDWQKLPGGVFRRGFIRSTGRFLGLDEESLIAEYTLETKDTPQTAVPARVTGPDLRHALLFSGIVAAILLIIASFFMWRHFAHRTAPRLEEQKIHSSAKIVPLPGARVSETPGGSAEPPTNAASFGGSAVESDTGENTAASQTTSSSPVAPQQPSQTSGNMAPRSTASPSSVPHPLEPDTSPTTQDAPALLPSGLSLHIQATRETRIRVLADGEEIYKGTMEDGQWRNFRAVQGMEIFADDGGAIQLELNGKPIHAGAAAGQPLHVTLPLGGTSFDARQ